jgi:hypothetical protein
LILRNNELLYYLNWLYYYDIHLAVRKRDIIVIGYMSCVANITEYPGDMDRRWFWLSLANRWGKKITPSTENEKRVIRSMCVKTQMKYYYIVTNYGFSNRYSVKKKQFLDDFFFFYCKHPSKRSYRLNDASIRIAEQKRRSFIVWRAVYIGSSGSSWTVWWMRQIFSKCKPTIGQWGIISHQKI